MPFVRESLLNLGKNVSCVKSGTKQEKVIRAGENVTVLDFLPKYDKYLIERITRLGREILEVCSRDLELAVLQRTGKDEEIRFYLKNLGINVEL